MNMKVASGDPSVPDYSEKNHPGLGSTHQEFAWFDLNYDSYFEVDFVYIGES